MVGKPADLYAEASQERRRKPWRRRVPVPVGTLVGAFIFTVL